MGLETGTYIADLNTSNPVFNDPETQGDDHLRLIKSVLQATFPGASRAFPIPSSVTKSGNYTILSTDQNKIINVNTSAGNITLTLPILGAGDYGWSATIMKNTTDTNAILIVPGSGTLASGELFAIAKCRRAIPYAPFRVIWSEGVWVVERVAKGPLGSLVPFVGASLPVGYEWPNGQTLASASTNYVEYNTLIGSGLTPDWRQRIVAGSSLGGADPARITTAGSGIDGTTVGSAGGAQTVTLAQANLPNATLAISFTSGAESGHTHSAGSYAADSNGAHTHSLNSGSGYLPSGGVGGTAGPTGLLGGNPTDTVSSDGAHTHTVSGNSGASSGHTHLISGATASINGNVAQTAVNKMPPTIITNWALVVE